MQNIFEAIKQYAEAYKRLELLQRTRPRDIPVGDQKTGVIAEFYARIYAKDKFPKGSSFEYGSPSEKIWDIKVRMNELPDIKIQVKAVSAHSKTSNISEIHPGWQQLWLIRLDEHLRPVALGVIHAEQVGWSMNALRNKKMPKPDKPGSGSAEFQECANETQAFLAAISSANPLL